MSKTQVKKAFDEIYLDYQTHLSSNLCIPGAMLMTYEKNKTYLLSSGILEFGARNEKQISNYSVWWVRSRGAYPEF